jgi:hypothetical protein
MTRLGPTFLSKDHIALLDAVWSPYEQALRFGAIRNLLPADDALLPAAAVWAMRQVFCELLDEFPGQKPTDLAVIAEALVHLSLDARACGLPVAPPRQ